MDPIVIIERITEDGQLPLGFLAEWSGPPDSIPQGWRLANLEHWLKAKPAEDDK
jgi:hypothetical protein